MTNGEKFCIDFPNIRIEVFVSYVQVVGENYEFNNLYPLKWWSAEYKEPTTKNDEVIEGCECFTCKYGDWKRKGWSLDMADDKCGGCCSWNNKYESIEPTTKNDLGVDAISRKAVQTRLKEIINEMETIFADIREREVNDSVCGLCEYDCDHGLDGFANECPGFEKDDCFKLNEKYRAEWLDISNMPSVTPQEPIEDDYCWNGDSREKHCPLVEAIPKAEYEARLKADLKAILVELQLEIEELDTPNNGSAYMDCVEIIQQKIDAFDN